MFLAIVDDEMFHTIATIGTYDEIASLLNTRFGNLIDRIEFSIPVNNSDDESKMRSMISELSESDGLRP